MDIRLLTRCSVVKEPLSAGSAVQLSTGGSDQVWVRTRHQRSTCRTASRLTIAGRYDLESVEVRLLFALSPGSSHSDHQVVIAVKVADSTGAAMTVENGLMEQARRLDIDVSGLRPCTRGVSSAIPAAQVRCGGEAHRRMPEHRDPF